MSENTHTETKEEKTRHPFSFPTLSIPLQTFVKERVTMELAPEPYQVHNALHSIRELLGQLNDYELIQRVTGAKDRGVKTLWDGILTGLPQWYDSKKPEEYEQFLTRLEALALEYLAILSSSRSSVSYHFVDYSIVSSMHSHPHALLVYALAIGCLGEDAYYYAQTFLEYFGYYRIEFPELPWVRNCLSSFRFGYGFGYGFPPDFSRSDHS